MDISMDSSCICFSMDSFSMDISKYRDNMDIHLDKIPWIWALIAIAQYISMNG